MKDLTSAPSLRALVVDDEVPLTEVVGSYLKREGFEVHAAYDGPQALVLASSVDPDVVVLDVGLPGIDGFEVCRRLRIFSDAYVIMLTARDTEVDTVVGLSVGADDYITKPFSPRELVARIQAMLRRPRRTPRHEAARDERGQTRRIGALCIDVDSREVRIDDSEIMLTRTEFDLLDALTARPGKVLGRRQLIEIVWGDTWVGSDNIVDVHVGHLRRKLGDDPAQPRYVTTVRGVGYRMGRG
ncbi:MAG: response regulator transcription factor [Mycobacterium sp.]